MLTGLLFVVNLLVKLFFERAGLPALVGYLGVGLLLRISNEQWALIPSTGGPVLDFLAAIGLATLLFRVGLDSNLAGLLKELPKASLVAVFNLTISGLFGYATCIFLLDLPVVPALLVGVAFCATSIGISVAAWQTGDFLDSPLGRRLLDVAELDDIAAIIMMGLLFVLLQEWHYGGNNHLFLVAAKSLLLFLGKLFLFGSACLLFSRYLEKPLTHFLAARIPAPDPMLSVIGIAFIFAAAAGMLGFSLAIGAFLAGLVFSRDPEAVRMEASFTPVYELFTPFFFIGVGLKIDPTGLGDALWPGLVLLIAAVAGKLLGNGLPLFVMEGLPAAVLVSVSMVPRAEITMVIMSRARELGDWALPKDIYSAVILVCAVTCLVSPVVVRCLLKKWPSPK